MATDSKIEKIYREIDSIRVDYFSAKTMATEFAGLVLLRLFDRDESSRQSICHLNDAPYHLILPERYLWQNWVATANDKQFNSLLSEFQFAIRMMVTRSENFVFSLMSHLDETLGLFQRAPQGCLKLAQAINWLPFETLQDFFSIRLVLDYIIENDRSEVVVKKNPPIDCITADDGIAMAEYYFEQQAEEAYRREEMGEVRWQLEQQRLQVSHRNSLQKLDETFTPPEISSWMVAVAKPELGERIYDPCFGSGRLLTDSFDYLKNASVVDEASNLMPTATRFFGNEISTMPYLIGSIRFILTGMNDFQVTICDSLQGDRKSTKPGDFDLCLADFPSHLEINRERFDFSQLPFQTESKAGLFLQHSLLKLRPGGRAVVSVPTSLLTAMDQASYELRRWLVEENSVDFILSIPKQGFLEYRSNATSLMRIRRGKPTQSITYVDTAAIIGSQGHSSGFGILKVLFESMERGKISDRNDRMSWELTAENIQSLNYDLSPVFRNQSQLAPNLNSHSPKINGMKLPKFCVELDSPKLIKNEFAGRHAKKSSDVTGMTKVECFAPPAFEDDSVALSRLFGDWNSFSSVIRRVLEHRIKQITIVSNGLTNLVNNSLTFLPDSPEYCFNNFTQILDEALDVIWSHELPHDKIFPKDIVSDWGKPPYSSTVPIRDMKESNDWRLPEHRIGRLMFFQYLTGSSNGFSSKSKFFKKDVYVLLNAINHARNRAAHSDGQTVHAGTAVAILLVCIELLACLARDLEQKE